ncbi:zinc finger protein 292 isoform A [Alligator mississippiensis]|uniref:Zinc finger protein 292 n=1 Tax=Alligator mississippiensis TaxID=8496 RepID=A0A151MTY4_ALLMI|nr:zinc finger protein 292 isoform A [Alligator mississippiensis]
MADEEAEQESGSLGGDRLELRRLRERLLELETGLRESAEPAAQAAAEYCQQLCQTLLEYAEKWKTSEDPLPLLEVYRVAIQSYVKARPYLTSECEKVAFVLERLSLSCVELLLCLPLDLPENKWENFQAFVRVSHEKLMENGSCELHFLATLTQEKGAWKNPVLCDILSQEPLNQDKVNEFLESEGPVLLDMRIKHLMKTKQLTQATALAKLCSDHPEISTKGSFKQTYLVCLCSGSPNEKLMEEIAEVDCKDALEMICNLESDGDEKSALILCAAFLSRQLQQGEMYCAWELTLFWSKLQQRVEPSVQVYLERCRQLSVLTKTVYHIFFLIKVINSEIEAAGLATCIELCVKALRLESSENADVKISICKTISCLLPDDLEVKRACQLSEFLLEPTVDAYYAVEMLYNQPDQKYDEENLPIPNSLRCELLLVLKTQWPFDPEFWDWKTLKRQCLALMGEEASIVSSIDELNDSEVYEKVEDCQEENKETSVNGFPGCFDEATSLLKAHFLIRLQQHRILQISEDSVNQNFEKTMEIIKTARNSQILEVKSEIQDAIIQSPQDSHINTAELSPANTSQNTKLTNHTQFAVHTADITGAASNSSQSESSQKDDVLMLGILEGLQKLRLENDLTTQESDSVSEEPPADILVPVTPAPVVSTEKASVAPPSSETSHVQFSDKVHKPFVCQDQGCNYSAMTKDALFKHYGKVHQYTPEMILEIKKHQLKYAPFKCVVTTCPKTFTRNSNLRAHCQIVHHFTTEEMVKLKIKRPYGRRSQNENINATPRPVEIKSLQNLIIENKNEPQLAKGTEVKEAVTEPMKILEKLIPTKNIPEKLEKPPQVVAIPTEQLNAASVSNMQIQPKVRKIRRHRKEKEERKRRKPVTKSLEFPTRYSPYRPYRCVHQGCFAAFTIQQNLILHYQAVHKSDLPVFSVEVEEESEPNKEERDETETKQTVKEFRCEVSDCSRIFQEVTSLIQHYMKLHEMSPEEIGSMKSALDVGKFPCDQSHCKSSFTAYFNYIVHLETDHGIKIRQNKVEEDGVFKCDCEGCDRIYATRSNLLRHIFNKHNDKHKDHLIRPRRLTPGQENISSKANQEKPLKAKHRGLKHNRSGKEGNRLPIKTKRKKTNNLENKNTKGGQIQENKAYSLKRGKNVYSIKARNDALSECTSRFVTQYPCMIKGCSSVVTSESNIIRHYKCHKLSKAFTSQHRNLLIVSKKHSATPVKEASGEQEEPNKESNVKESDPCLSEVSNDSSTSTLPQGEIGKGEKDEVDELTELFITKLINEDCMSVENQAKTSSGVNSDLQETSSEKQKSNNLKRANKEKNLSQNKRRKIEKPEVLPVEVSSMHREEETAVAIQTAEEQPTTFDWSSFKPMGFEVSFLKFLEESAVKQKKNADRDYHTSGTKKGSHSYSRKSTEKTLLAGSNVTWACSESETFVQFANPSQLQCSGNVKIVLDKTLKDYTALVLKQLQEMKPTVSLKKLEGHWENDSEITAAKEMNVGKEAGDSQY